MKDTSGPEVLLYRLIMKLEPSRVGTNSRTRERLQSPVEEHLVPVRVQKPEATGAAPPRHPGLGITPGKIQTRRKLNTKALGAEHTWQPTVFSPFQPAFHASQSATSWEMSREVRTRCRIPSCAESRAAVLHWRLSDRTCGEVWHGAFAGTLGKKRLSSVPLVLPLNCWSRSRSPAADVIRRSFVSAPSLLSAVVPSAGPAPAHARVCFCLFTFSGLRARPWQKKPLIKPQSRPGQFQFLVATRS